MASELSRFDIRADIQHTHSISEASQRIRKDALDRLIIIGSTFPKKLRRVAKRAGVKLSYIQQDLSGSDTKLSTGSDREETVYSSLPGLAYKGSALLDVFKSMKGATSFEETSLVQRVALITTSDEKWAASLLKSGRASATS